MATRRKDRSPLWRSFKEEADPAAREQLITEYLHLVKYVANRVAIGLPDHVDYDDLYSYGIFGLVNAVDRFDRERGIKFETYAITCIKGAILDGLRTMDWAPPSLRQKAREIRDAYLRVEGRLRRSATDEEIAAELGISFEEFHRQLVDVSRTQVASLDETLGGDPNEGDSSLFDLIGDETVEDPFSSAALDEAKSILAEAIARLPERERLVIMLYYYEGLTAKEISLVMNRSASRVSQLHSKALFRLRGRLSRIKRVFL